MNVVRDLIVFSHHCRAVWSRSPERRERRRDPYDSKAVGRCQESYTGPLYRDDGGVRERALRGGSTPDEGRRVLPTPEELASVSSPGRLRELLAERIVLIDASSERVRGRHIDGASTPTKNSGVLRRTSARFSRRDDRVLLPERYLR